ncbi:SDR family oxidoreductase [Wenzhouxiangella marina]|uniref:3-ketoacyl-ACP reductase n=1 Tax=Wenzhouxiangella marina TaxID=1579979 RepID=A0A0K0XUQ1_9GAMM|nr:SDR family oxidoreductase [Wenzhouxiangella marina]AKS41352.1 3-ketoacyl-ACP reductase [Wenzhouxiangella marina]MBB6086897.1 3-oxoacyl-[acyl-carrier protein] reductase [Wenzhouxiangella marina]
MNIDHRRIIITGAARGLGRAAAMDLAARGARIGLIDLDEDALARSLDALPGEGHASAVANVADEAQVERAFDALVSALGGLDVLVNNAGITRDGLLVKGGGGALEERLSLRDWQQVIDVNLTGVFLCGREAASHLLRLDRPGLIINVSSISRGGNFGQSNYSAAKAGVAAMTVTWAKELARHGIRAASLSPGFTRTELVAAMPEAAIERIAAQIPAGRMAEPEEMADAIRFIIENDYFNGRDLAVDGGLRL